MEINPITAYKMHQERVKSDANKAALKAIAPGILIVGSGAAVSVTAITLKYAAGYAIALEPVLALTFLGTMVALAAWNILRDLYSYIYAKEKPLTFCQKVSIATLGTGGALVIAVYATALFQVYSR